MPTIPASSPGGAGSVPEPILIADGADITQGAKADPPATDNTGPWSVVSILKGIWGFLSGVLQVKGTRLDGDAGAGTGHISVGGLDTGGLLRKILLDPLGAQFMRLRIGTTEISGSNPVPVSSLTATVAGGQAVIATTGTRVQLSGSSKPAVNGIIVKNVSTTLTMTVGGSTLTNTVDGTGNGFILGPGESQGFAYTDANLLYINGTIGAIATYSVS